MTKKLGWKADALVLKVARVGSEMLQAPPVWRTDESDAPRWRADAKAALLEKYGDVRISKTTAREAGCCPSGIAYFAEDASYHGIDVRKGRRYTAREIVKALAKGEVGYQSYAWRTILYAIIRENAEVRDALDIHDTILDYRSYKELRSTFHNWVDTLIDTASPARVQEENGVY